MAPGPWSRPHEPAHPTRLFWSQRERRLNLLPPSDQRWGPRSRSLAYLSPVLVLIKEGADSTSLGGARAPCCNTGHLA